MWQPQAGPPRCSTASNRLDRASQAGQRIAQIGVPDICQRSGNSRRQLRVGPRRRTRGRAAQRGLPQPDGSYRLPPEEAVDPLQDYSGEMLNLERYRPFDAKDQPARLRQMALARSQPLNFFRLRVVCDLGPYDLGPAGDQFGRGKSPLGKSVAQRLVQKRRERSRLRCAGLVHALATLSWSGDQASSADGARKEKSNP
jgi:hypothetical protein